MKAVVFKRMKVKRIEWLWGKTSDTRGMAGRQNWHLIRCSFDCVRRRTSRKSKSVGHDGLKNHLNYKENNYMIQIP